MHYAVVVGGSGLVGRQLLNFLTEHPRYQKVISLGRRKLDDIDAKISQEIINFNELSELSLDLGADTKVDGFCCLGSTRRQAGSRERFYEIDHDYVVYFSQLMWRYQAQHLSIVSSLGANARSLSHYARTKGQMEQDVKSIGLASVSVMRPSLLLGKRPNRRLMEDLAKPLSKLMVGPLAPWSGIEASDVAKTMVAMAEQAESGFRVYPSWKIREIAAAY